MSLPYISTKEEYIYDLKNTPIRTIENYLKNPNPLKKYINLKIGFFALCSYQPQAWNFVFKSIRNFYPNSPIILYNDGCKQFDYTEMAKEYNCIYIEKNAEICCHYHNIDEVNDFLNRLNYACLECAKLNIDWIVNLHPDVILIVL